MSKVVDLNKHFMVRLAKLIAPSDKKKNIAVLVEDFELSNEVEEQYSWALDAFYLALRERHRQIWKVFFITPRRAFWSSLVLAVFLSLLIVTIFVPIAISKIRAEYASSLVQNNLSEAKNCIEKSLEPGKCMEVALGKVSSLQVRAVNTDLQDEYNELKGKVSFYKQKVNLNNPVLEKIIREELDLQKVPLTQGHLREITELNLSNTQEFESLNDLPADGTHNLRTFSIQGSAISDLASLGKFGKLQKLDLSNTQVRDLTFITKLRNLENLKLSKTSIEDLNALTQLGSLQTLSLSYTNVHDLTPLSGLSKLRELFLVNTKVNDLEPLTELQNLKSLYLSNSEVPLQPIERLWNKGLKIYIDGDQITNLNNLPAQQGLENQINIGIVTFLPEENEKEEDWDTNERFIGKHVKDAAEIVVTAINEDELPSLKGILKSTRTKVELFFQDEDAEISLNSYKKWTKGNKLDVVVGFVLSDNCEEVAHIAEESKVLTILTNCGSTKIFEEMVTDPKYLFRTASHATMDSVSMVRYFKNYTNKDTVNIATLNPNYSFGKDSSRVIHDSLDSFFKTSTFESVFVERGVGKEELSNNLRKIEEFNPDITLAIFSVADLLDLTEGFQTYGFPKDTVLALPTGQAILPILNKLPNENLPEIIFGGRGSTGELARKDNELSNWFQEKFEEKNKNNPDYKMPNYYAYRMSQALFGVSIAYENAFGDDGKFPETDEVIKTLEGLEYESPSGKIVMALANGHQAIQETAVGTLTVDSNGNYKVDNIEYFDMWCVNPPPHMSSSSWINSKFKGAKCD